jgi:hypothetical protein
VPPVYSSNQSTNIDESSRRSIVPWLLVSAAIVIVGIVGIVAVVIMAPGFANNKTSSRTQVSPTPMSKPKTTNATMCGQTVSDAILDKWNQMGGETGKLGCPINQETEAPTSPRGSVGRWIQFGKGDGGYLIENTGSDTGRRLPLPVEGKAVEVTGCMFMLYSSLGGTKAWLGFPTGDGRETSTGARQDFEGGYILWDRKTSQCRPYKNDGIGSGDANK